MKNINLENSSTNEFTYNQSTSKKSDVRICEKYSLTVPEAAAYFGIGEKTLRGMISKYKNLGLFLEIGTKHMIKREMFAKFLDKQIEI